MNAGLLKTALQNVSDDADVIILFAYLNRSYPSSGISGSSDDIGDIHVNTSKSGEQSVKIITKLYNNNFSYSYPKG